MQSAIHTYRVGDMTITGIVESEIEGFQAAQLFPTLDLTLLREPAANIAYDQQPRPQGDIVLPVTVWLVQTPRHTILVDTGTGNGKTRSHPAFHQLQTPFLQTFAEAGVTPDQVDLVLHTHLHVDHVGWNTRLVDGSWQCTFENALHYCSELELAPYDGQPDLFADSIEPVISSGRMRTVAQSGETILDGIRFEPTPGHTKGHMSIRLEANGQTAYFGGDLAHHPIQIYDPSQSSRFCINGEEAERSRRRVFSSIANTDTLYFSCHFAGQPAGKIRKADDRFCWNPL